MVELLSRFEHGSGTIGSKNGKSHADCPDTEWGRFRGLIGAVLKVYKNKYS